MSAHIWEYEDWSVLKLCEVSEKIQDILDVSPKLGEMSVHELCHLAKLNLAPVGIYIFADAETNEILYVGKTHGRSLQERMISHIDHRDPVIGSPHLAQFVTKLIKTGTVKTREEAVDFILGLKVLWMTFEPFNREEVKHIIAKVERKLMWNKCLDPKFISERFRGCESFSLKGVRFNLSLEEILGN